MFQLLLSIASFDWFLVATATLFIMILSYIVWNVWQRVRLPYNLDMKKQSILLDEKSLIYGSVLDGVKLKTTIDPAKTLYNLFLNGMDYSKNGDCLGTRKDSKSPYQWYSYADVMSEARNFGSGLYNIGLKRGTHQFVGIYSKNRPEWFMCALGCITQSLVIVPFYNTLDRDVIRFIINQTQMQLVVCEKKDKVMMILDQVDKIPSLKHLVTIDDDIEDDVKGLASSRGIQLNTFAEVAANGYCHPVEMQLPHPDDLYAIMYTSGTGIPKGVMLTHKNLMATINSLIAIEETFDTEVIGCGEAVISYLPLSHIFEQAVHWFTISKGGKLGYFRGAVTDLMEDMMELKPNCFPAVPRILNKLHDQINEKLSQSGVVTRTIFNIAYEMKLVDLKKGIVYKNSIWDMLVFNKIQKELGGKVRFMVVGSAPIAPKVLEMCRVVLGAKIVEVYGQTEIGLVTHTWMGDHVGGHVGPPTSGVQVRLTDIPEMNFFAKNGQGEVCVKSMAATEGYFNDPSRTAELIDGEGWLHTGDVGEWLPNGVLKIIDRKKHIFKLAQGEYVAPEKIVPVVSQIFVDGRSIERYLVGIVVPIESILRQWLEANEPEADSAILSFGQLCEVAAAKEFVLSELQRAGKDSSLNYLEQVKNVKLISEPFSVENGLLTPILKPKRLELQKRFLEEIDVLYK